MERQRKKKYSIYGKGDSNKYVARQIPSELPSLLITAAVTITRTAFPS